ncbi:MAG: glutamate--tRNA ligase [Candidatus Aenigmarchaeota archaeon]|nr:glutamate--tRNA ligase [Candidatus Aenigmarchaeota archaeon]
MAAKAEVIRKHALLNAAAHGGRADEGSVLGRVLAEDPSLKQDIPSLRKEIAKILKGVNSLTHGERDKLLAKIGPGLPEKKSEPQGLPELEGAVDGQVVTRFAPAPTGPLHISHILRAAFLSYLYARKYHGKFCLRLEDTDAKKVKKEFYGFIQQDLESVGIKPDAVAIESDNIEEYYRLGTELVKAGKAYVCLCPAEQFRKLKLEQKECGHRNLPQQRQLEEWEKMLAGSYAEGEAVVRMKTSMAEANPVLRDPPLFRVAKAVHPRKGSKHSSWPLYNFACAVEDHKMGITHVFRAKEHEHNTAVQGLIYKAFGWKEPVAINFGMIHMPGKKLHKRDMRKGMDSGEYEGWDDVRLPTLRALLRRGFQPKAMEQMAKLTGVSKTDIKMSWENLEGINRKLIDPMADRYMAALAPEHIELSGSETKEAELQRHPDFPERGKRKIAVNAKEIYIPGTDFQALAGKEFRLIGIGNFRLSGRKAVYTGDAIQKEMRKLQFVSSPCPKLTLLTPDGPLEGVAEPAMLGLPHGTLVHMLRIGFGRIDFVDKKNGKVTIAFAHK